MAFKKDYPKISIIIPCYNMVEYIEETILSIVQQDYKNCEIIIVDGLSNDGTLQIIEKYKDYFDLIISEKDKGQYYAINKGMNHATGDILAWINADDVYFPWTLRHAGEFFKSHPDIDWISGATTIMNENGLINGINRNIIAKPTSFIKNGWFRRDLYGFLQQEGMFWRKELWIKSGGLNEKYKLAADFELWIKFGKYAELVSFGLPLAAFRSRIDSRSKIQKSVYSNEVKKICKNLNSPSYFKSFLGKYSILTNMILKKLTVRHGKIYYYSSLNSKWVLKEKYTTMSTHTLTTIISLN
jgi:glycosyltransferase involved in cell wall biosynthesis